MDVIPILKGWKFVQGRDNTTGTRVYITSTLIPGASTEALPELLDSWSDTWPLLKVTNINAIYIDGGCGQEFTVNYSALPVTITSDSPTQSIEIASENFAYNDSLNLKDNAGFKIGKEYVNTINAREHWQWPDTSLADKLPFRAREVMIGYNINRMVYATNATDIIDYIELINSKVGKINIDTFQNIPAELALFIGADMSETTFFNQRKWNTKLSWIIKVPNGTWLATNGHNLKFRPATNSWELIKTDTNKYMYESTTFTQLISDLNVRPPFPGI